MKSIKGVFVAFLMLASARTEAFAGYGVGIKRITTQFAGTEPAVRVFYPTSEQVTETQFVPWKLVVTRNAIPASGQFPLIAVSHGLSGNDWNHHLLAQDLVAAGFIVAAVRHPDDLLRVGTAEHAILRPLELSSAIDTALSDAQLSSVIDAERIGAFGF